MFDPNLPDNCQNTDFWDESDACPECGEYLDVEETTRYTYKAKCPECGHTIDMEDLP